MNFFHTTDTESLGLIRHLTRWLVIKLDTYVIGPNKNDVEKTLLERCNCKILLKLFNSRQLSTTEFKVYRLALFHTSASEHYNKEVFLHPGIPASPCNQCTIKFAK